IDVDFRFDDWHKPRIQNLSGNFKLLLDNCPDSFWVQLLDDRTHLGTENLSFLRFSEKLRQTGDRLHQLNTVRKFSQSLVDFKKWNNFLLFPQELRAVQVLNLAFHRLLKQNGT